MRDWFRQRAVSQPPVQCNHNEVVVLSDSPAIDGPPLLLAACVPLERTAPAFPIWSCCGGRPIPPTPAAGPVHPVRLRPRTGTPLDHAGQEAKLALVADIAHETWK